MIRYDFQDRIIMDCIYWDGAYLVNDHYHKKEEYGNMINQKSHSESENNEKLG